MDFAPRFLNGIYPFSGSGLDKPIALDAKLAYTVPADRRSQLIYLRAGNSTAELIVVVLMRDGKPMRYFAVGAKDGIHVPLAVVEDLQPDTKVDVFLAAPEGTAGFVVIDIGLMEI